LPPPPPKKGLKATVHKVFILDAQGGYAGEYSPDEGCMVEFGQFLAAVPKDGLADGQTIFLAEWRATAINGDRMSLVVISKGQLGPEEVGWAKAALVAAEAQLTQPVTDETPVSLPGPDKAVMENLASALQKREAAVAEREQTTKDAEARSVTAWNDYRQQFENELATLRQRMAEAEKERDLVARELEAERGRMRAETQTIAQPAKIPLTPAPPQVDPKVDAMRAQTEKDRKYLQKYALDLLAREEKAQQLELASEAVHEKLVAAEKEIESLRVKLAEAITQASKPTPEMDAQRRELDMRVRILQDKAMDLLAREEKLRERETKLRELMKQIS